VVHARHLGPHFAVRARCWQRRAANLDRSAQFRSCVPSFDERNEVV
jgi:hypothetical protein